MRKHNDMRPHDIVVLLSACTETTLFSVSDKKASKTRLLKFLKLRSLHLVNDWFKNENNAVFDVFLQNLLKIIALKHDDWKNSDLANSLQISTSEITEVLNRCMIAGLVDSKKVKCI